MARRLTFDFLKTEAASGAVLGVAAVAALIVAKSPWSADYFAWLEDVQIVQIGPIRLAESVAEWIKEGLMALFFLVIDVALGLFVGKHLGSLISAAAGALVLSFGRRSPKCLPEAAG